MSTPRNIFLLLRKGRGGQQAVLLKDDDFPIRLEFGDKRYVVKSTKAGKLLMVDEKTE